MTKNLLFPPETSTCALKVATCWQHTYCKLIILSTYHTYSGVIIPLLLFIATTSELKHWQVKNEVHAASFSDDGMFNNLYFIDNLYKMTCSIIKWARYLFAIHLSDHIQDLLLPTNLNVSNPYELLRIKSNVP